MKLDLKKHPKTLHLKKHQKQPSLDHYYKGLEQHLKQIIPSLLKDPHTSKTDSTRYSTGSWQLNLNSSLAPVTSVSLVLLPHLFLLYLWQLATKMTTFWVFLAEK